MIDKIVEEKKKRYDKLHELLSDPKVLANSLVYQGYARELSGLTPLVHAYNEYLKISNDIKDLNKVLSEKHHEKEFFVLAEEEKHKLEKALKGSEARLEELITEKESGSDRDIIMEIRAGTGGLEASLFAGDLLR